MDTQQDTHIPPPIHPPSPTYRFIHRFFLASFDRIEFSPQLESLALCVTECLQFQSILEFFSERQGELVLWVGGVSGDNSGRWG